MNKICAIMLLAIGLSCMTGCGMLAMTVVDTARGGTSEIMTISPVRNLHSYDHLDVKPFTSNVGGLLSNELLVELNNEVDGELSGFVNKTGSGKGLIMSGSVIHVADGTFEKQIVMQIRMQDATDGQTVGLANISAHANSIRGLREGVAALAEGLVDLLAENKFSGLKDSASF
ncbi:MAG: hypothetical protein D6B25_01205 [Desulfobulbaceae bacterium]|nr:MAG: hypothetical protein D6B25_01205 [Desulfobulbaceae bacterium]